MLKDIDIARNANKKHISALAEKYNIPQDSLFCYGNYMAKIDVKKIKSDKKGNLILVSAINPTAAGEGKTTVSIGLADGIKAIGKSAMLALREPSMGPVFGMKGGACGGGMSQVVPMEDINLHFTGDFHALTSANNLLSALIDNHIHKGNSAKIDRVTWKKCLDMNDRQLRFIVSGLNGKINGVPREDGFDITPASELMATFCLAVDMEDLRIRLSRLVIGYTIDNNPITASDIGGVGSLLAILKHAISPNLVQTLENTPALIHGGPFANIAHGCNSVIATKTALKLADYVVTEAGFGADLGAEKFIDIKCRYSGLQPSVVVIVATIRALKNSGGVKKDELNKENIQALEKGMGNLLHHINVIQDVFNLKPIVAVNKFHTDTDVEIDFLSAKLNDLGVEHSISDGFAHGSAGTVDLAHKVTDSCKASIGNQMTYAYELTDSYTEKINAVAKKIYGADGVEFAPAAKKMLKLFDKQFPNLPICVAKTQYSLSDDPSKAGLPKGFIINVRDARISAGAGFVVLYTGSIITMPGLPKHPAAYDIDLLPDGEIDGLF